MTARLYQSPLQSQQGRQHNWCKNGVRRKNWCTQPLKALEMLGLKNQNPYNFKTFYVYQATPYDLTKKAGKQVFPTIPEISKKL